MFLLCVLFYWMMAFFFNTAQSSTHFGHGMICFAEFFFNFFPKSRCAYKSSRHQKESRVDIESTQKLGPAELLESFLIEHFVEDVYDILVASEEVKMPRHVVVLKLQQTSKRASEGNEQALKLSWENKNFLRT